MDGRLRAAIPVALLLALALAGCMGGPHFENAGASEVTARSNLALAASAAKAWDPAARLVGIAGGETREGDEDFPSDPDVGNGLAVLWTYVYQGNDSSASRAFEVSADGTVVSKNESEAMGDYGMYAGGYAAAYQSYRASTQGRPAPLGEWPTDSDGALDAAMGNDSFAGVARHPNATLAEALGNTGVPGAWIVVANAEDHTVIAVVNATSGELATVQDLSQGGWQTSVQKAQATSAPKPSAAPRPPPQPVKMDEQGSLSNAKTQTTYAFHADAPMKGFVNLTASFNGDATRVGWAIVQGKKTVASGNVDVFQGGFVSRASDSTTVRLREGGDYTLVLTMEYVQGAVPLASASYQVTASLFPTS